MSRAPRPSSRSLCALDWLNVFLADVRDGVGPYLAIYLLATHDWDPASIGMAMSIGFAVLPVRGFLYTLHDGPIYIVAVQLLDGIGAGIFSVVWVLVVADLTRGTGRFNVTQGAIATAVGLGAALSNLVAGYVVAAAGYNAAFLTLTGVAAAALALLYFTMPDTHPGRAPRVRFEAVAAPP